MLTKEQIDKVIPKTLDEVAKDPTMAAHVNTICIWTKMCELGFFKDLDEVMEYQKQLWDGALRERIIEELYRSQDADK